MVSSFSFGSLVGQIPYREEDIASHHIGAAPGKDGKFGLTSVPGKNLLK